MRWCPLSCLGGGLLYCAPCVLCGLSGQEHIRAPEQLLMIVAITAFLCRVSRLVLCYEGGYSSQKLLCTWETRQGDLCKFL